MFESHARFTYNKCVDFSKKQKYAEEKQFLSWMSLRNLFVTKNRRNGGETGYPDGFPEWLSQSPKDIRAGACREFMFALKACFAKQGKFEMSYRRKKNTTLSWSIEIPKNAIRLPDESSNTIGIYPRVMKERMKISPTQLRKDLPEKIKHDCRLVFDHGRYYLCIPIDFPKKKYEITKGVCASDPGVRTFQTIYSENKIVEVKVDRELRKKLRQVIEECKNRRKRFRAYHRRKDLNTELHYKTLCLLRGHQRIFLSNFETQGMVRKGSCLGKSTKYAMLHLEFYKFKVRALQSDLPVSIVQEWFTTKTCGCCGHVNNVGSRKVFKCAQCNLVIDRDFNGARNILLKSLYG
jgi:putative transposase